MACVQCPASMCPLIAPKGSPWTGRYGSPCPEQDDLDNGGCPWWSMACGTGALHAIVDDADKEDTVPSVVGPVRPKRSRAEPRSYDCPKAAECSWQKQSGEKLCAPRYALSLGLDPRIVNF